MLAAGIFCACAMCFILGCISGWLAKPQTFEAERGPDGKFKKKE